MASTAFSPCHVTGFFKIFPGSSAGAGVCLEKGMTTKVRKGGKLAVSINGRPSRAPVSRKVAELFARKTGVEIAAEIHHSCQLPIGYGFGASGAGALSLALALNEEFEAGLSPLKCAQVAHESEVSCRTGLGTVSAELTGGFVWRKTRGKLGENEKIRLPARYKVVAAFLAPMRTGSIISSPEWKKRINRAGETALEEFSQEKTPESFMRLSRQFAFNTGLAAGRVRLIMEKIPECSMAMLGRTVFSLTDEPEKAASAMKRLSLKPVVMQVAESGAFPGCQRL